MLGPIEALTRDERLEKHLGTKVHFWPVTGPFGPNLPPRKPAGRQGKQGPGQLALEFYDEAHLYGLYERLMKAGA